ncbi:glycosyltransferase [Pedobacter yonginense]|nr:glycosyltransferase [Pedobacter yonginense]
MMNNLNLPLVSIVVCTYNAGPYLNRQLDTLVNQSYKNLEIIVVDDFSTDATLEVLDGYRDYPFFKIYTNETNIGFNKNFERGISFAKGDFIAICDQDDIWALDKIELLVRNIGENHLIFSNSELIDSNDIPIGKELLPQSFNIEGFGFKSILLRNFVTGHTCLFSKGFASFIIPLPESGYYDWFIGFRALYYKKIKFLNLNLTSYRVHKDSVIQKSLVGPTSARNNLAWINYKSTLTELRCFKEILALKQSDKLFIEKLVNMYETICAKSLLRWILFIYINYNDLFPFDKKRKLLSKTRMLKAKIFVQEVLNVKKSMAKSQFL